MIANLPRFGLTVSRTVTVMRAALLSVMKPAAGRRVSNMFGCDYIHVPPVGLYMEDKGLESTGGRSGLVVGESPINSVSQ